MLDKLKDLYKLKTQMDAIKKELDNTVIDVECDGVRISITGSQEVKAVKLTKELSPSELERVLKDAVNRAVKDSQQAAARKMGALTGMALPGM